MIRFASLLLLLIVSAPIFAETPIVYSRCAATTQDFTVTDDVIVGGVPVSSSYTFRGMDVLDQVPDVRNSLTDFTAPCDLMRKDAAGVETVLHDCSTTGSVVGGTTCAALDAAVSFDGLTVTYALFEGTLHNLQHPFAHYMLNNSVDVTSDTTGFIFTNNKRIHTTGSKLRTVNIASGVSSDLTSPGAGVYDSGPAYVSTTTGIQNKIAFTSTRTGAFRNLIFHDSGISTDPVMAMHLMDEDGGNIELIGHHDLSQVQHPYQTMDGKLAFSTWMTSNSFLFSKGNSQSLGFGTTHNFFSLWDMRSDGTLQFPIFGQHNRTGSLGATGDLFVALHNITQKTDGNICTGDYYRQNNNALGSVFCFQREPEGQEGRVPVVTDKNDFFLPNVVSKLSTWGTMRDNAAHIVPTFPDVPTALTHANYTGIMPWYGKAGFPFALPSNGLGIVWGVGSCSIIGFHEVWTALGMSAPFLTTGNGNGVTPYLVTELSDEMISRGLDGDIPGCNLGIYRTTVNPSTTPADLVLMADSRDWHEIYPRAAVPYTDIYGISQPAVLVTPTSDAIPKGSPFGMLGAASVVDRETRHPAGIMIDPTDFGHSDIHNMFGTDAFDYTDDEICGVEIIAIHPNEIGNIGENIITPLGERQTFLGQVYTRNKDVNGDPILDINGNEDTSFLIEMPANIAYTMSGIDCDGNALNRDQAWQSLKPKELKTCGGCHVHSRPPLVQFSQSHAATPGFVHTQLGKGNVPMLAGLDVNGDIQIDNFVGYDYVPEFTRDIRPILESRCVTCHATGGSPGAGSSPRLEAGLVLDDFSVGPTGLPSKTGSTHYRLVEDNGQIYVPSALRKNIENGNSSNYFVRPQLTRYIKLNNARGSLLYWKLVGSRTDNRLDTDHATDIDFGSVHPATTVTAEEIKTIARWINIGAPAGSGTDYLTDTHKPTLVMSAIIDGGAGNTITGFNIGTVDLGSGIDVGTLNVCLRNGGTCTNIAPAAQLHGITTFNLGTPISDVNQIVEASVSDISGNTRDISFDAGFLLAAGGGAGTPSQVVINVGGSATVNVGDTFSRTITFSDGEDTNADGWTYSIDWNGTTENGSVAAGLSSFNISRLMSSAGPFPVTVTITDDVGETANGSFTITVDSVGGPGDLTISTGGDAIVNEGTTFTRTVSFTDGTDTGGDGWTVVVDWGGTIENLNVAAGLSSFDISRLMPDGDAVMTVSVDMTDVAGDVDSGSFQLTTLNVNPRGTITGADTVAVDALYSISIAVTDPGDDTIQLTSVDWGDGTFNNEVTHTYTQPCSCKIKVQVVDEDGVFTVARKTVTVQ